MKNRFFLILYSLLLYSPCLPAQPLHNLRSDSFILNAAYNRFWQSDSTSFLEIATAFYANQINLKKDSTGYHGEIEVRIIIQKKSDGSIINADRFAIPVNISDSSSVVGTQSVVSKINYVLGCGSYVVTIFGSNSLDRLRRDSTSFMVEIGKKPGAIAVSDVELCSNIIESTDRKDMFYKNSYRVIPNPSLLFGKENAPVAFSYSELYNLYPDSMYSITVCILNGQGTLIKYQRRNHRYNASNVVEVNSLNVLSIPSGKYRFAVVVADTSGHEIAHSEKPIFIHNPHLVSNEMALTSAKNAEFVGLTNDELADEFRKTQYIASSDDIKTFEKLTTAESRREFLAKFWTSVENGQRGRNDLTHALYLERVLKANQRYTIMGKQGWHTDRGRVYILYGEPDEVQRFPSSENSKPYEIWNYYQIESGVQFVFIDRTSFGDYQLVHSTKRGELQDEGWQQYLQ